MNDSLNNKELVAAGHKFAKALSGDTAIIDIAKMVSRLAEQLDCTTAALREMTKQGDALAVENAGLSTVLMSVIDRSNEPAYQSVGMGCGVEDNGLQTDGYGACEYGWREAMERMYSEVIPEELPETPATDAYLAEVRAQGVDMFVAFCGEENSVFVEAKAYYRSLPDAAYEFVAQLRQGGAA
ncbi:hNH endonuclease [Escherichia coli]|uniref:hNH endonuclease n=1 Tax=Escherichia coli TaxID=562 RepID=UPI0021F1B900|nr:hNH endonuclease [Escherichia coli]MCV4306122.1 hNH endonuclease [Escherichia coli]